MEQVTEKSGASASGTEVSGAIKRLLWCHLTICYCRVVDALMESYAGDEGAGGSGVGCGIVIILTTASYPMWQCGCCFATADLIKVRRVCSLM